MQAILKEMGSEATFAGFKCRQFEEKVGRVFQNVGPEKECLLNFSCLKHGAEKRATKADQEDQIGW